MSKVMLASRAGALLGLLVASNAYAGGYEIPENTTRALGRAGANIASVDDASAIYLNPAGMASVDGVSISFSLNLPLVMQRMQRSPLHYAAQNTLNEYTIEYTEERNKLSFMPAPMLFVAYDFGLKNTVFGFGAYGPSASPSSRWPMLSEDNLAPSPTSPVRTHEGSTAYQMIRSNLLVVYPSFTVAHKFEDIGLSIGGALQIAYGYTDVAVGLEGITGIQTLGDATVRTPDNPSGVLFTEDPASFVEARVRTGGFGITGNFGLRYEPSESWAVGLSYRPAHKIRMKGTFEMIESPALQAFDLQLVSDEARMTVQMPHVLRGGVAYRHVVDGFEVFDLELAATYEMWSIVNKMIAETPGPISSVAFANREIANVEIPFYFKNTVSLRLGGDYNGLLDRSTGQGLVLRGGLFWESNGQPKEYSNIFFMPYQRVGLSAGLSYNFQRVSLDFGVLWLHAFERTVDNGELNIINPLWVCLDPNALPGQEAALAAACEANGGASPYHAVNNGTFKSDHLSISAGMTWNW